MVRIAKLALTIALQLKAGIPTPEHPYNTSITFLKRTKIRKKIIRKDISSVKVLVIPSKG